MSDSSSMLSLLCPCSSDEVTTNSGDWIEDDVEWLENEALAGFRIWQLAAIILSIILVVIIAFCCCMRFRIPRTKQNIEADHIRKKLTQSFRHELGKISNTDMDEMDLKKALDRVRAKLNEASFDSVDGDKQHDNFHLINLSNKGIGARIRGIFHRILRTRYAENSTSREIE